MPLLGLAAEVRIDEIIPANAAITAVSTKSATLVRPTLTPRARAAWALPPEAWIQLPALVAVQDVAEDQRRGDEPEERGIDAERADVEVADQDRGEADAPRRSRSAAGSRR